MLGPFNVHDHVLVYDPHGQAVIDEGVITGAYPPVDGEYAYDVSGAFRRLHPKVPAHLLDHLEPARHEMQEAA